MPCWRRQALKRAFSALSPFSRGSSASAPLRSLDAYYYTDPAVFAAEPRGVLARTWQFAGHTSQLPVGGDYFTFEIAGESLFCVRSTSDQIKAYYDVCQHRAHELVQGTGNARRIVCPYHAWTYALSGELNNGPNLKCVAGLDRSDIRLSEVRIESFHGFLFVNLDPDARPMEDRFPRVREELGEFVPHIDVLVPGLPRESAQHLSMAPCRS